MRLYELPMMGKMVVPFMKYYFNPSVKTLYAVIETMGGKGYLFSGRQSIQQGKRNLFGTDYYYRDRQQTFTIR